MLIQAVIIALLVKEKSILGGIIQYVLERSGNCNSVNTDKLISFRCQKEMHKEACTQSHGVILLFNGYPCMYVCMMKLS